MSELALTVGEGGRIVVPPRLSATDAEAYVAALERMDRAIQTCILDVAQAVRAYYREESERNSPHGNHEAYADAQVREWLSGRHARNYVNRVISVEKNTRTARAEGIVLPLSKWAEIAPLSHEPDKQIEIARQAQEHDLPVVSIIAAVRGTDEQEERQRRAFFQLQDCWGVIADAPGWADKAKAVVCRGCVSGD